MQARTERAPGPARKPQPAAQGPGEDGGEAAPWRPQGPQLGVGTEAVRGANLTVAGRARMQRRRPAEIPKRTSVIGPHCHTRVPTCPSLTSSGAIRHFWYGGGFQRIGIFTNEAGRRAT